MDLGPTLAWYNLISIPNYLQLQRLYFQTKSHSVVLNGHEMGGVTIQSYVCIYTTSLCVYTHMSRCMHILALPTVKASEAQHSNSSEHTWHLDLGFNNTTVSTNRNQDSLDKWLIPQPGQGNKMSWNILF